ncbi:MAG: hypothetical protein HC933_10905 [Pleurocapsa sp. SU_196_0]|nr:hypothetical protein [Pleurocapsa sp. SU_196_0]
MLLARVQFVLSALSILVLAFPSVMAVAFSPSALLYLVPVWSLGLRLFFWYATIGFQNRPTREVLLMWRWNLACNLVGSVFGILVSRAMMVFSETFVNALVSAWVVCIPVVSSILGILGLLSSHEPRVNFPSNPDLDHDSMTARENTHLTLNAVVLNGCGFLLIWTARFWTGPLVAWSSNACAKSSATKR